MGGNFALAPQAGETDGYSAGSDAPACSGAAFPANATFTAAVILDSLLE